MPDNTPAWITEFKKRAKGNEPPEIKTYQILDLINERDKLRAACEAALPVVEWYAGLLQDPSNKAPYLKIAELLREALNQ